MALSNMPDSLWAATAVAAPVGARLDGDIGVDVAIIGAGFTGLRAALVLAEAGCRVAVFDAGEIGWGASGRNGGQVNPIGHQAPVEIRRRWGRKFGGDYAERYVAMTLNSADELFTLLRHYAIECDAERNGWIRAAHGAAAIPEFEKLFSGWQAAGADIRLLERDELQQLSGSDAYRIGWLAASAGVVQPLAYVRGLAGAAIAAGAEIYQHAPIDMLSRNGRRWSLSARDGKILADQVIFATNAYSDQLVPGLRESIVPVVSIQAATKPLTAAQDAQILPRRHSFADTRRVIFYFRKTADNRLVFGSAGDAGEMPEMADRQRILHGLRWVYPQFSTLELEYVWGGKIAVTIDRLPHIHQPAAGLNVGLGCNGRGVALATVMGRLLAEIVLGKPALDLPIPLSAIKKYPFHRFHRVGIKLALAWKERWDRREAGVRADDTRSE